MDVLVACHGLSPAQLDRLKAAVTPGRVARELYVDDRPARSAKAKGSTPQEIRALEQPPSDQFIAALQTAEIVLALDLPLDTVAHAPRLRWVQGYGAGVGHLAHVLGEAVPLTSAAGVSAASIAEFVIGRVIQVLRRFRDLDHLQGARSWQPLHTPNLAGRHLALLGYGHIGEQVARIALALGMSVTAVRRHPGRVASQRVRVVGRDRLLPALSVADVIVVCAAETPETTGRHMLLGRSEIRAVKRGAVLVNIARGTLVDEQAVECALVDGQLGAAVLDVVASEPLAPRSGLWDAPNAYVSAHTSASTDGYDDALLALFLDNFGRFREHRPLRNLVDPALGY